MQQPLPWFSRHTTRPADLYWTVNRARIHLQGGSGPEALEVLRSRPVDLLITDQTMPGIPGAKLAEAVMRARPNIPVILCTGYSEVIDENEARSMGIREFVLKPFSIRDMAEAVRRALKPA